jgi:cell division protein FtsQ
MASGARPKARGKAKAKKAPDPNRFKRWAFIAVVGLTVVGLGAVVWLVGFSSVLAVQRVDVSGVKLLGADEVISASGVTVGSPQVLISSAQVADRIAGLSPVEKVQVSRDWPNAITITVVERTATALLPYGTGYLIADANGVVFDGGPKSKSGLLRVETDPLNPRLVRDCQTVAAALSAKTAKRLKYVSAKSVDSITLQLDKSQTVNWGTAEQSELKAEVLDALLEQEGRHFDVSSPANPTKR